MSDLLTQTVDKIFADHCSPDQLEAAAATGFDAKLWSALEQAGLTDLADASLAEQAIVIRLSAYHCAYVPIGEALFGIEAAGAAGAAEKGRRNLARLPYSDLEPSLEAALLLTIQLAGAAEKALDLTVRYATERVQFGRPIAQFQAVQQQVAIMAAEVAAMRAAADAAVDEVAQDGFVPATFAVAAAKAHNSKAAGEVARIAHQMHGAIGFTYEHQLRFATTRLWSWRDEAGNEAHWARVVGEAARNAGGPGLWPLIAGS